jgi:hypothetical protein
MDTPGCRYRGGGMQLPCRDQDTVVSLGPGYRLCARHARHMLDHHEQSLTPAERETLRRWWLST